MERTTWLTLLVLALPTLASAEAMVCEMTATPGTLSRFVATVDPTQFVVHGSETCDYIRGESATAAQITLYNTVPGKYVKTVAQATVAGTVQPLALAEKSPAEKQAIDDALAAEAAQKQAYKAEVESTTCKYNNLDEVTTKSTTFRRNMDAVIESVTNVTTTRAALHELMDRVVLTMATNLARCDLAHFNAR